MLFDVDEEAKSPGALTVGIANTPGTWQDDALIRAPLGMDLVRVWESSLGRGSCTLAGSSEAIRIDRTAGRKHTQRAR
jgi:hypothetical protein